MTPAHHQHRQRTFVRLLDCRELSIRYTSRLEQIERMHDHNTEKFIECIRTSHNVCGENNLVAIKVTALIRPNTLRKFNNVLQSIEDRSLLPSVFALINDEQKTMESALTKMDKRGINLNLTTEEFNEIHQLLLRLNRITRVRHII